MSQKKEIFLIPYAHLDTQWRWEYPTTIDKYIKNTLEENIRLFEKYKEHRFNFTGALRYQMMKEYYPKHFEKVKQYIVEGRWNFTGTSLDETDTLVPSVESMIRNVLYGDRWAKNEFGEAHTDRTHMIPDCFGFPANMPSVLAHCGLIGFSSQKLTWNSAVGIPFDLGLWEGPDGNSIVSALNPGSYVAPLIPPVQISPRRLKRVERLGKKNGIWKSFQYYGVGDIGGAPREVSVKSFIQSQDHMKKSDDGLVIRQGSPHQFFSELSKEEKERMDSYSGDLLLVEHSAGTLTSATIMKRWNRKNEQLAFAAEVAATQAMIAVGVPYPNEKIKSAWYRIVGNQMHDILTGTSTPTAYEYSHNDEVIALKTWETVLQDSATAIAPLVKGDGTILLFNPLGETRCDVVDIDLPDWNEENGSSAQIVDAEGNLIHSQLHKNEEGEYQFTFIPELKPFSWSRFSIAPSKEETTPTIPNAVNVVLKDNCYVLENSNYRVEITDKGKIQSIFHKKMEKELLSKPLAYEFLKERPKMFPSWNMDWKDRKKAPFHRIEDGGEVSILENGLIRCTVRITIPYNNSKFVKDVSLSHDAKAVEFTERINWRESGYSLKLALDANMTNPEVTYNWETSRIKRGLNNEKQFEMPSRYWADISDPKWGISLIEDSKYGYDHPENSKLRMTLVFTPGIRLRSGFRDQKYHDWGQHTIRYGIYGHEGDFKGTDHLARRFNQKIRSFSIDNDETTGSREDVSLFEVSNDQLGILAVKKAEDSDNILIRVYERYGEDLKAEISFNHKLLEVKEVNGLEEAIGDISIDKNKFTVTMQANGIRSYIVKIKTPQRSYDIEQEIIKLDYNSKMIGNPGAVQAPFPSEITPENIQAGPISYQLSIDELKNSLQCTGQKINLPKKYNTLSILIGSKKDQFTSFKFLGKKNQILAEEEHHISPLTGYIGQWDTRLWKKEPVHHLKLERDYLWANTCTGIEPGFINRERLEWYSTHTNKDGKRHAYHYGYLFTITLDIPEGTESILLPDDSRIQILAMTASQQSIKLKNSQHLHDKFDF